MARCSSARRRRRDRGEDDHTLVTNVERQVTEAHPDPVGKLSREDILAMAKEA
jgi:hypothetical protein